MQWKLYSVIILLLVLPLSSASILQAAKVSGHITITGTAHTQSTGTNPVIDYIHAYLYLIPKAEQGQDVTSLVTQPLAEGQNILRFSWENPTTDVQFSLDADFLTSPRRPHITKKILFPLTNVPSEAAKYLELTDNIDTTVAMRQTAVSLATSDDLYEVVGTIATWIHENIHYNLSTLTEEVVQPSSWVYENRFGVCDEITSLFISMLRSLGVPARYVSGMSYTNLEQFDNNWVSHAWAEVYFPGYGWVPFDITYGELGYIDATHITLRKNLDSQFSSATYEYRASDATLSLNELDLGVNIIGQEGTHEQPLNIDVNMWKPLVTAGSSNVVIITITNPTTYYVMERIALASTDLLEIKTAQSWFVFLKPEQTKRYYAHLQVSEHLVNTYEYTFPVVVYDATNKTSRTEFKASRYGDFITPNIAEDFITDKINGRNTPVPEGNMTCTAADELMYENETTTITCEYVMPGKKRIRVCLEDCKILDHKDKSTITFNYTGTSIGATTLAIRVTDLDTKAELITFVPLRVSSLPNIRITNLQFPQSITYDGRGLIEFALEQDALSPPEDVTLSVRGAALDQTWTYKNLREKEMVSLAFVGRHLTRTENNITISLDYYDRKGQSYHTEQIITITLSDLSFSERIALLLNNAGRWLAEVFS